MADTGKLTVQLTAAFEGMTAAVSKAAESFKALGEAMGQLPFGVAETLQQEQAAMKLKSTATTWVMKNKDGQYEAVAVSAMTNDHLFRWVRYFRKKYRDEGFKGDDAMLDATIRTSIITAPAIFAEAQKRGVYTPPQASPTSLDPLVVWTEAVKRTRPQFFASVLAHAESVEVGDRQVTVAFTSVQLRDQFDASRPLLDRLANQAWRGPMSVIAKLTTGPDTVALPFKVKRKAEPSAAPGERRIELDDEE